MLTILFSSIMTFMSTSVINADQITVERVYDSGQLEIGTSTSPDGTLFQTMNIPGFGLTQEPGFPQLPVEYIQILVPVYSRNFHATLTSIGNENSFCLDNRLFPAQTPIKADGSDGPDFTFPSYEAYSEEFLPDAWVVGDGYLDGCNHIVTVAVRPVSYNDASLESILYGNVTVSLTYDNCGENELESARPLFPPYASKYINLAQTVVNSANINSFAYSPQRILQSKDKEYYYIIVPESLKESVGDLAIWKQQKGYTVVTKTIEDILRTPEYYVTEQVGREDEAASLRAYLQDEFSKHGTFFCLLVGNYKTSMPMRKFRTMKIPKDENHSTEEFLLSDMYFSDLTTNWIVDKPSPATIYTIYYNAAPKVFNAAIHVGRVLASTPEELNNYIYKLKLYEANPGRGNSDYLSKVLFFEQHQEKIDPETGESKWASSFIHNSYRVRESIESTFDITYLHDAYDDVPGDYSTGTEIIQKLNNHGFSSWHGHGSPFSCMVTDDINFIISTSEVAAEKLMSKGIEEDRNHITDMNNLDSPSIVYSISCTNAPFDEVWNGYPYHNLAQAFTVCGKWGGPAFLGYTRESCFFISDKVPSSNTGPSTALEKYFFENLKIHKKIGIAESLSKDQKYSYTWFSNNINHVLIGEPEFEIWLGKPKTMSITPQWNGNVFSFSGEYPDSLRVSLSDGIGNVKTMLVNGNTNANIRDASIYSKDYLFSAWASGYLPVIRYFGQNNTLTGVTKKFLVRDAILGGESVTGSKFSVGNDANLSVDAIDAIETTDKFEVTNNGNVVLQCDRSVTLEGSTVKSGGSLSVKAQKVTLKSGFKVEKGASFKISGNK